jgi:hypothetical protein
MNEVKSALAKVLAGFVHKTVGHCKSCVHISFCPITLQVLNLFNTRMVQADSCLNSEQIDTLFISVWGGQRGVWGVGGHFGPAAQNPQMPVMLFIFSLLVYIYIWFFGREITKYTVISGSGLRRENKPHPHTLHF